MISKKDSSVQIIIAFAVYVLSGFMIFSPLHKSENLPLSLLCAAVTSTICVVLTIIVFTRKASAKKPHPILLFIFSISATVCALFYTLILLTEIIKDTAYIANRGVSLFYYTITALAILLVSCYLSFGKSKGIYRFCILSSVVFALFFVISSFSVLTTKNITANFISQKDLSLISPALSGAKAGLFYTADSIIFLFCCKKEVCTNRAKINTKKLMTGFYFALILITVYNLFTYLIFGRLTSQISDPDYALIKLVRGFDMTELVSAVRIVSFMIKSSLCMCLSAKALYIGVPKLKLSHKKITLILYALIPAIFLIFAIYDKTLEYGAFQHLVYPVNAAMALFFILFYCLSKN